MRQSRSFTPRCVEHDNVLVGIYLSPRNDARMCRKMMASGIYLLTARFM